MTPEETLRQALLEDKFPESDEKPIVPIADPLKYNRMTAVSAWMGNLTGQDVNPEDIGWQAEKDALAQEFFKMPNAKDVTDETVHDLIRSHIQTSDNATSIALDSALSGRSFSQTLNEVQAFTGVSKTRGIRDRYVNEASNLYGNVAARVAPYRAMINNVAGTLSKEMESALPTTDAFQKAADALLLVPVEDRALVINAIGKTGGATAEERASYLSKLAGAMGRITETIGASVVGSMTEAAFAESAASLREAGNFGFASAMEGEADKQGQYRILTQMIRQTADSEINPIKGDGWLGQLGIDVARMVPQTAITVANPAIGFAANLSYFQDTQSAQAMMEDSSLTYKQAQAITALSAPISAAAETITALIPFGKVKLPFFSKWIQATTTSTGAALRNLGVRAATGTAGEITEEYVQSAAPLISQELLGVLSTDMPDVDWENRMPDFSKVAAETWAPALVFSLIGAGATSISDIKSGRKLASDLDLMVASGVNVELAGKIKTESDAGNWSQVDGLFREEFVSKSKASAPDIQAATDRLKARFKAQENIESLTESTSPDYTASVTRTPTGWQVTTGEGTIIPVESAEAARRIAVDLRQVGSQQEANTLVGVIDSYYEKERQAETALAGETVQASNVEAVGVVATRRDAGGAIISQRQLGPQALETVRAEAEVAGIKTGTQGIFAHINGSNEVFPMRVADGAKEIVRQMNLYKSQAEGQPQVITFLHENFESTWKLGMTNGTFSDQETRTAMRALLPAFEGVTALNAEESQFIDNLRTLAAGKGNETMLRETVSEMVIRDVLGRDRQGRATGMKPGSISRAIEASVMGANTQEEVSALKSILAAIKAFTAYLKGVFGTVDAITKARDEGKLGEEYDTFINKVLGIDEVKQMESQAVEEGKAMLGVDAETQAVIDAGNMAFSTSRAQPANTSNITEMPDGAQLVGPTTFSIEVYHGTPHKVSKFLMDKIGTGEGNQAFGWGLYFAKARKVAEGYQRALSDQKVVNIDGLDVYKTGGDSWADTEIPRYARMILDGDIDSTRDVLNMLKERINEEFNRFWEKPTASDNAEYVEAYREAEQEAENEIKELKTDKGYSLQDLKKAESAKVEERVGNLYTVELLPDEADFLDWDKPLSEQSEKVQKAIRDYLPSSTSALKGRSDLGKFEGQRIYTWISNSGNVAERSKELLKAGIPGIRYLDGGSRASGEGTSNYVIFDENLVKILEENGQKVEGPTFSISPVTPAQARNAASAVNFKENPFLLAPQKTRGRVKVVDLARALDQRAVDLGYKRDANDYSQETINHISDAMAEEIAYMLQRDGSGVGWYDVKINSALDLMSRVYPELNTDPEAKLRFLVMVASISQGNAVDLNFEFADRAYGEYRATKKLPTFPYPGKSNEDITRNIAFLFEMIDKIGAESTFKLLKEVKTVREWNKLGYEVTGEIVDAKVTGAMAIMGSKIGSFFGNLNGDFTSLTADLWFSRSWNRYTGNMESLVGDGVFDDIRQTLQPLRGKSILHGFSKDDIMSNDDVAAKWVAIVAKDYAQGGFKDKTPLNIKANTAAKKLAGETNDAPRGGVERQAMRATVASAIQKVVALGFPELTMADAQAILWFNEKDLFQIYKAVNKTGAKTDYETAAQDVIKSHGLNYTVSDQFRRDDGGAIQPRIRAGTEEFEAPIRDDSRTNQGNDNSQLSFSISPIRNLNELSDQVERNFAENPVGALEVKSKVIRQFAKLADKWSQERWTPQGNKIRPISEKRTVKSLDKEQAMRQATLEGEKIAANMDARQAQQQAKAEAQAWRTETDAMQKEDWSPRESLVRDLITLEAIVAMFPQEIRGKIGGFVALARKASESARLNVLQKQLERGQTLLEKHLKDQYGEATEKLFDKYRPERKAGEKPKGKLDPDAQEIADKSESVMDLNADQVNAEIAAINVLIEADNISAEEETKLEAMRELVQLLGDWKNADSARRESAFIALNDVLSEGWAKWKMKQILKREQREEMRKLLKSATGKKGVGIERDKMKKEAAKVLGKAARWVLNLSSFGEVMTAVFGAKVSRQFIDNERSASNQYEDAIQDFSERIDEFFTILTGGVLRGERLRFDLAQPTLTIGAGGMNERNISQLQGIQALLMWQQEDGRRHMEGPRDENGAPIDGKWSYDQAWIDELTGKLTPEAVEVKKFIEQLYGEEWVPLNAVYRERHGVNLPRHDKYAPITVTPQQAKAGEMVDPVSGAAIAGSILTPGSLRSRNRSALAEPDFRDALSTFIAHTKQMEHWKSYYDIAIEMQAVLGNRDVANSVKAAVGDEGVTVLKKWVNVFAQGGTRDAAAGLAISGGLGKLAGRVATVGLLGRFSTLLVQSTQLAAASVKMPTGSYLKRLALLMSGNLQWSDAINSEFIQRRIKSAPPLISQAMQSLGEATRPNEIKRVTRYLGQLLSGADGLFTAGTYAILLDYHRTMGAKMGMEGNALESYAHAEAVNATEQVAQPVRTGARSIIEVTNTNPLAKMSWAYASEARQKMALFAWSAYNAKNDPTGAAKTAFLVFVVGGLMSQLLKNLWREAKGDDDEKKWSPERLAMSLLSPITSAIPGASMLAGEGGSLSGAQYTQQSIKDVFDGKADMKDVDTILSAMGYFNDTAGGIATLSHAGYDFAQVLENAFGEE